VVTATAGSAAQSETTQGDDEVIGRTWRGFNIALAGIVLVGVVARIVFIEGWTWGSPLRGDPLSYQQIAANIAHNKGYVAAFLGKGPLVPTAEHPPVFSLLLATLDILGLRSVDAHRIALAFIGSGGVFAMGILGRRLAGPAVGLVAATIAALSPVWVQQSGFVMSESIYLVIIPTILIFALRCLDRPSRWNFAALGGLIAVATLTRSEAIDFVVLLAVPVLVFAVRPWKDRFVLGMILLAGMAIILGPWLVRNDVEVHALTLSTNGGDTLAGSYCQVTFSPKSPEYGGFSDACQFGLAAVIYKYEAPPNHAKHWTEPALSDALSNAGTRYARSHVADLPGVVLAREGRVWGVYAPGSELAFDVAEDGNGAQGPKQVGQVLNWVFLPLAAIGGIAVAKRSRRHFMVLAVPILVVALNAAAFYGSTRLRTAAEPSLAIFASVCLVMSVERLRQWGKGHPQRRQDQGRRAAPLQVTAARGAAPSGNPQSPPGPNPAGSPGLVNE
jgi:4-amino-4-deoxy-L-arabinose transferase-like glycosyltransferase